MGMNYVIGSGPAGLFCAQALNSRGLPVTILDAGMELEPERDALRAGMAPLQPEAWNNQQRALLQPPAASSELPVKLSYGSDYPYRTPATATRLAAPPGIFSSYAKGGLSTVWGSAMLPFSNRDLAGWPVGEAEMAPAYRAVLREIPLSGVTDDLAETWPLYTSQAASLPQAAQAKKLLQSLHRGKARLHKEKTRFGVARLAVDAAGNRQNLPCIACGQCLNGCPRDLIYSTNHTLPALRRQGVAYIHGVVVKRIEDDPQGVRIFTTGADGAAQIFAGANIFLGAGIFNTAEILLRSFGGGEISFLDSQYFLLPLLQFTRIKDVRQERLHSLAQVFMEIDDPAVSTQNVHLQIYAYNALLASALAEKLGALQALIPDRLLLERMLIIQGYLHSSESGRLAARLVNDGLKVTQDQRPETGLALRRLRRKLMRLSLTMGALPVGAMLQQTAPGRGFHSGGSYPMADVPKPGQTDRLGRLYGHPRVHLIDASVFPTIPAATITLSVMANAWRIGQGAEI